MPSRGASLLLLNSSKCYENLQAEKACPETVKRARHSAEQIVKKLHEAAMALAGARWWRRRPGGLELVSAALIAVLKLWHA